MNARLRYRTPDRQHSVEVRVGSTEQLSNQSYLGLTDQDFAVDPYRRYAVSAMDNIVTSHDLLHLRYRWQSSGSGPAVAVTYYKHDFSRTWFKTEGVDLDGSANAESFSRTSWNNLVQAINKGEAIGSVTATQLLSVLNGSADSADVLGDGALQLRSNARTYVSSGFQASLDWILEPAGGRNHSRNNPWVADTRG